jgi:hypothetical protein
MHAATQINRNRIGQKKTLVAMRPDKNFPKFCRQTCTPFSINGCLENSSEHGHPVGIIFHNMPLFSTVMELIPMVKRDVNIKCAYKILIL